jgi:chlorite dismutase
MPEPTPVVLNHFALVRFTEPYWRLDAGARTAARCAWLRALRGSTEALHLYQVYGLEAGNDLLVWTAQRADAPDVAARFFAGWAAATAPARTLLEVRETLWGFTKPSQYTKTRSTQEMDPFAAERRPYLIAYPFVKTAEWYLTDRERRQEMMAGHIKIGKQYPDITQLLLYSTGLQDQEFVVVYETDQPLRFLDLVQELRATEARRYTLRDAPLHTGVWLPSEEALAAWL